MLKIVSLFAGIGGFELGLAEIGQVIWANEWNKFAGQTYRANFPTHNLNTQDIRKIKVEQIPPHDLLVAGFPCQTFSVAQTNKSKQGLNDLRGHLFKEIIRIATYHKPMWILLENVKGLTFKNNRAIFELILNSIKDLGYQVNWQVLNAKDFGLPQNRERVFIVANRSGIDFEFPIPPQTPAKISDILEQEVDQKYYLSPAAWQAMLSRKWETSWHKQDNSFYLTCEKDKQKLFGQAITIFQDTRQRNRISQLNNQLGITPALTGFNLLYIYQPQATPRHLIPRECLRLQGFPENYQIVVSDSQLYRQAGNAVAIPVVQAIGIKIKESLINFLTEANFTPVSSPTVNFNIKKPWLII